MAEINQGGNLGKSFAEIHGVTPEEVKAAENNPAHLITAEDLNAMQHPEKDALPTALDAANKRYPDTPATQLENPQPTVASAPTVEVPQPSTAENGGDPILPDAKTAEESSAVNTEPLTPTAEIGEQTPFDAKSNAQETPEGEHNEVNGFDLMARRNDLLNNGGPQEEIDRVDQQLDEAKRDSIRQERAEDREVKRAERTERWNNLKNGIKNAVGSVTGVAKKIASGIRNTFDKAVLTPIDRAGQDATTLHETGKSMFAGAREMISQSGREKGAHTVERQLLAETGNLQSLLEKAKTVQSAMDTLKQSSAPEKMLADNDSEGLIRYGQQLGDLQENLDRILDRNGGSIGELQKRADDAQERTNAFRKEYETVLSGSEKPLLSRLADMLEEKLDLMTGKIDARDAARAKEDSNKTLERQQEERQQQENTQQKERQNKAQEVFSGLMRSSSNGKGRIATGIVIALGLVMGLRGYEKQNDRPVDEGQPGIGAREQKADSGVRAPGINNETSSPEAKDAQSYLDKIHAIIAAKKALHMSGSKEDNQILDHFNTIESEIVKNPSTHEWSPVGFYNDGDLDTFVQDYERMLSVQDKQQQHLQRQKLVQRLNQLNIDGDIIGGDPVIDLSQIATKVMITNPSEQTAAPLKPASDVRVAIEAAQKNLLNT